MYWLCVVQSVQSIRGRRQSPSHGLTTPVDRLMRRHALTLCLSALAGRVTGLCVLARTIQFSKNRPSVRPWRPAPWKRRAGCLADRVQGNLLRLLERSNPVNPDVASRRSYG